MSDTAQPDENPSFLAKPDGARIAYHRLEGKGPGIVFMGGFASDMTGTKAMMLEAYARQRGQAFLRFDYQGHGQSSGVFADGTIGLWHSDALAVFDAQTDGPQIVIGSSMGGWMAMLTAVKRSDRVSALIGIAAAPDFTEDLMWAGFSEEIRETLRRDGVYRAPSDYSDEPYTITYNLIVEGRNHLLLRNQLAIRCPVRLLHGMKDEDVPYQLAIRTTEAVASKDVRIQLVKEGDHRLSEDSDLSLLARTLDELIDGS